MIVLALVLIAVLTIAYNLLGWFGVGLVLAILGIVAWRIHVKGEREASEYRDQRARQAEAGVQLNRGSNPKSTRRRRRGTRRFGREYSHWSTVAKRENYLCHICGGRVDEADFTRTSSGAFVVGPRYPTVDHVVPKSKGGTHHWKNLKLAHHQCNSHKSDRDGWQDANPG